MYPCLSFHLDNIAVCPRPCKTTTSVKNFFKGAPFDGDSSLRIATDPLALLAAAQDSLRYLNAHRNSPDQTINPQQFRHLVSYAQVERTLKFIIKTIQEDRKKKSFRIMDPEFLRTHFEAVQWRADDKSALRQAINLPHDGKIRLTSYAIFSLRGSYKKTKNYPCGLYQLFAEDIQKKYTKHQILAGALEKKKNQHKRRAFAWVSRQGLEDALMHGTVIVKFADGATKILNVDQNNGIAYDRKQKNILAQKRYWFFRELKNQHPSHQSLVDRFVQRRGVIFAGDVYNIGFGKVIALSYQHPITGAHEVRLGILADTGGAFVNNLYQLDMFGGVFASKQEFKEYLTGMPLFAHAMVLYKR
jgi:hypothetical protein